MLSSVHAKVCPAASASATGKLSWPDKYAHNPGLPSQTSDTLNSLPSPSNSEDVCKCIARKREVPAWLTAISGGIYRSNPNPICISSDASTTLTPTPTFAHCKFSFSNTDRVTTKLNELSISSANAAPALSLNHNISNAGASDSDAKGEERAKRVTDAVNGASRG
ncbi:hypothetical protein D9758_017143 [Tetrapyrgos nigripes]|uniref:Uncharacterized protein n=1 Tax=Tetrapyrgos nigripes TaxID=182062 RepID=A0A8H5BT72_9AGAR|nr:hypothetical protein D9758_017143 [Tetrapyrgos nigripes]